MKASGLLNRVENTCRERRVWVDFGHVEFQTVMGHPSGNDS